MTDKDQNPIAPTVGDFEIEILDLEEFANTNGGKPPKAHYYKIRIDRDKFKVDVPQMNGTQILALVNKTPEKYLLNQKFKHGQVVPVGPNQIVDFTAPGVERFATLPKDQTEGLIVAGRQEFKLPDEDVVQLDAGSLNWETVKPQWLLIHEILIPVGYNVEQASVAIRIPANYPTAALDMAYFFPHLHLSSGRAIPNAQGTVSINGQNWQQWSRHYTTQNPWLPGEYNVMTHLALVRSWLERELTRS